MTTTTSIDGVVRAWDRWAKTPGSRDRIIELQKELEALSKECGLGPSVIHRNIGRNLGMLRCKTEEAVRLAISGEDDREKASQMGQ